MSNFALSCLHACQELVSHQKELVFLLAKTLDIQSEEVFYSWALRKVDQIGVIYDTNWQYFFHGLGCNIENIEDGRLLPVSFGPGGRVDTFTSSSVLQFIMTSKAPWQEFPDLRTYLAKHEPPYHKHSGSHQRMSTLWKRIQESGFIEIADPQLTSLVLQHTTRLPSGQSILSLPSTSDERMILDSQVHERWIITNLGWRVLGIADS